MLYCKCLCVPIMRGVWKGMPPSLLPDEVSQWKETKYSSECVLGLYSSFFHIVSLSYDTTLPVLKKLFEHVIVEIIRLFSKLFSHYSFNFSITREINFFESSKQLEVTWWQIQTVRKVLNDVKSEVHYSRWSGSTNVGYGVTQTFNNLTEKTHPFGTESNAKTLLIKLYLTANWSSKSNEQVWISSSSGSHCSQEMIPSQRHYFLNAVCTWQMVNEISSRKIMWVC